MHALVKNSTIATHDGTLPSDYEPTVNPSVTGGYSWVVFTSRRMYGNVATVNPWASDPRYADTSVQPTPKKLWVAAVDANAPDLVAEIGFIHVQAPVPSALGRTFRSIAV